MTLPSDVENSIFTCKFSISSSRRYSSSGFAANIHTVSELFDKAVQDLFCKMQSRDHCLNSNFTRTKESKPHSTTAGTPVSVPNCVYKLFKLSFLNHCLFKFVQPQLLFVSVILYWRILLYHCILCSILCISVCLLH